MFVGNKNKGTVRHGGPVARYLARRKGAERVSFIEARGVATELDDGDPRSLRRAVLEMEAMAAGSRCREPLLHIFVRPAPADAGKVSPAARRWMIDEAMRRMGLEDRPRVVVQHAENGHAHWHVVALRVNPETGKADELKFWKERCIDVAHEAERRFGLELVERPGRAHRRPEHRREQRPPLPWESGQAQRAGMDVHAIRDDLAAAWVGAENGRDFQARLERRGYVLARGERRAFVAVDEAGHIYALGARTFPGETAATVRARLADLGRDRLPTVDQARDRQRAAQLEQDGRRTQVREHAATRPPGHVATQAPAQAPGRLPTEERPPAAAGAPAEDRAADRRAYYERRDDVREAWRAARGAEDFRRQLNDRSFVLGRDARNRLVVTSTEDPGHVYGLDARTLGVERDQVRARLRSVPRDQLPTVERVRARLAGPLAERDHQRAPGQRRDAGAGLLSRPGTSPAGEAWRLREQQRWDRQLKTFQRSAAVTDAARREEMNRLDLQAPEPGLMSRLTGRAKQERDQWERHQAARQAYYDAELRRLHRRMEAARERHAERMRDLPRIAPRLDAINQRADERRRQRHPGRDDLAPAARKPATPKPPPSRGPRPPGPRRGPGFHR